MMEHTLLNMKKKMANPDQEERSLSPPSRASLPASTMTPSLEIAVNVSFYAATDSDNETVEGLKPHTPMTCLVEAPIPLLHK
ncbi:hypothetical protein GUJ93_ZPchr0012g19882 [Zizania palustris]|uniref:Uncharacterized protein n=1 Tax=Zizania palustris TaxID=103762 RepID=A0A8J5WUB6_ZIZPA|nr:hypothetical protein GUJ93_ZPchr0012g19882 [Zizania palustris]